MKANTSSTAAAVILLFFTTSSNAQFYSDMSVGISPGIYIYQGDLTPAATGSWKTPSAGLNLFAKKPINHFLAVRLNISIAKLKADESKYDKPEWRKQRNFAFSTPLKEFSTMLVWNVRGRNYDDHGIMPYVFTGAGFSFIKTKMDYTRMNTAIFGEGSDVAMGLITDLAHGTPRTIAAIPVGIGAEYPISNRLSVNLESSYRFLFSDYLDGFSRSANPNKVDHYHSTSAGLIYKFGTKERGGGNGKGIGCPVLQY